jgi:hypothetical protein
MVKVHSAVAVAPQWDNDRVFHATRIAVSAAHWTSRNELKHDHNLWQPCRWKARLAFKDGAHPDDSVWVSASVFTASMRHNANHSITSETGSYRRRPEGAAIDAPVSQFCISSGIVGAQNCSGAIRTAECLI